MQKHPKTVITITKGCLTLHKGIRRRLPLQPSEVDQVNDQGNVLPGAWRQHVRLTDNRNVAEYQTSQQARVQRNYLCGYYNAPVGAVPWQQRSTELNRHHQPRPQPDRVRCGFNIPQVSSDSDPDTETFSYCIYCIVYIL